MPEDPYTAPSSDLTSIRKTSGEGTVRFSATLSSIACLLYFYFEQGRVPMFRDYLEENIKGGIHAVPLLAQKALEWHSLLFSVSTCTTGVILCCLWFAACPVYVTKILASIAVLVPLGCCAFVRIPLALVFEKINTNFGA